ncbi:hypothetical protein NWP22_09995 [Anabaenopsis tanganyikae CS-531]|uniref:Uncharacterized protein n=1 Tax=Anabaenopsis tanganyikae CS-531 TaxID=2785304 RepID=A0ABT6KEL7_9CYAN|nr:hypothetical protein [Anabaenopsis tanganyikae]MDH6106193.1 hypothetical protein [Anabaenopsis tanganyikae CS-531]
MNKLILGLILLITYGCSNPILNSSSSIAPVDSSPGCPDKPTLNLDQQTLEDINLYQSLIKSGRVTATKSLGYRFDAESGQTLNYSTNDDVCIVVYTPDNQIIDTGELTTSGKYILEVSAPQGTRTFNLSMSLTTPQPVSNEPIAVNPPSNTTHTIIYTPAPVPQQATPQQPPAVVVPPPLTPSPKNIPISNTSNKSSGWIWLGLVENTSGDFEGERLFPSKRQPVTIYPYVVPSPGTVVTITTATNIRENPPQAPNYKLGKKVDKALKVGEKLIIRDITAFVDENSDFNQTRVWALVDRY